MSNIILGNEAVEGMMRGVEIAASLVRPTYGAHGSNVVIESPLRPGHVIANDAWTIIKDIKLTDPAEKRGLAFIHELTERQDKLSGDSRKTSIILTAEILKAGFAAKDINKLQLKRDLDALIPVIEKAIDAQTRQITVNEVADVATTASENPETGKILQEIYQKIGPNGIIQPESSNTFETSYRFIDGVRFDMAGYLSPFMVHDEQAVKDKVKETKAVYENPLILVTKKKITTDEDINPLLREMANSDQRDLVIFTQDMDSGVASMLIDLHKSKGSDTMMFGKRLKFNILIIKAPTLWQNYVFEDFAKCTGATIVEDATGLNFKNLQLSHLGTCAKLIVDEEETVVIGTKDISEHIASLTTKADDDSKLRLSWLTNKSVILKIGANSETDLSYKRLKFQDAIRSSQLALKYGVVAGGGVCLANVSRSFANNVAGDIMRASLVAPFNQICTNAGINPEDVGGTENAGLDVGTGNATDMFRAGIVDSAAVVKAAVRNAVGIASTILTAGSLVFMPQKTPEEMAYEVATQRNQAF